MVTVSESANYLKRKHIKGNTYFYHRLILVFKISDMHDHINSLRNHQAAMFDRCHVKNCHWQDDARDERKIIMLRFEKVW